MSILQNKYTLQKKLFLYVVGIFVPMIIYVICKKIKRGIVVNALFVWMIVDMYIGVYYNNSDLFELSSRISLLLFVVITFDVINLIRKK